MPAVTSGVGNSVDSSLGQSAPFVIDYPTRDPAPFRQGRRKREYPMANAHLATLNARHAALEASVNAENRRPMPDQARLAQLKREKLKLKEEISRLH
jgi:hypothetical protein